MCRLICGCNKSLRTYLFTFFISASLIVGSTAIAQNDSTLTVDQISVYSNQSRQLIKYLEGTLNFLGNPDELPSDKDVIFNSSYLKIFKNDKVQVEDDLDENREIPLNKDVQAYLKDIDFFYKNVKFHFEIEETEQLVADSGVIVFKLTLNRHLMGVTLDDDTINNNQLRYIEINLDPYQRDLKIASIYTTKIHEKEELRYWWNNMSADWKIFFGKSVLVYDTLPFQNILWFSDSTIVTQHWVDSITADTVVANYNDTLVFSSDSIMIVYDTNTMLIADTISVRTSIIYNLLNSFRRVENLDISNNMIFTSLLPISELTDVKEINISNTLIDELSAIRNLNKLEVFNCSETPINTLESLRYITALEKLNCSSTLLESIDVLTNLRALSNLDLSSTKVNEINALSELKSLIHLNISATDVTNLAPLINLNLLSDLNISNTQLQNLLPIDSLTNIQHLNIDSTNIASLEPLLNYNKLTILQANNTAIADLSPLNNHELLKVIYCDNSNVTMDIANKFMDDNPHCLVIYNSQELINWWNSLSDEWRNIFNENYGIEEPVTKEKLHELINQTSLTVAHNQNIKSLKAVSMLHRLESIELQYTSIAELDPLAGLTNLENINLDQSKVTSIDALSSLNNLKIISFNNTDIDDITPLLESNNIEKIYCDKTHITTKIAIDFKSIHPSCLIVYQSNNLRLWWNTLNVVWQQMLSSQLNLPESPSNEELQTLVDLKELNILNNLSIDNLNPLHIFIQLEKLTINKTSITDISPITTLVGITELNISGNPISELESIHKLVKLQELTLENTSVEELEPISGLENLTSLNISGTRVKSLKYIMQLSNLEYLYINNTRVRNIKHLAGLTKLKLLQCYNTSIKASKVKDFSSNYPNVEVVYY